MDIPAVDSPVVLDIQVVQVQHRDIQVVQVLQEGL